MTPEKIKSFLDGCEADEIERLATAMEPDRPGRYLGICAAEVFLFLDSMDDAALLVACLRVLPEWSVVDENGNINGPFNSDIKSAWWFVYLWSAWPLVGGDPINCASQREARETLLLYRIAAGHGRKKTFPANPPASGSGPNPPSSQEVGGLASSPKALPFPGGTRVVPGDVWPWKTLFGIGTVNDSAPEGRISVLWDGMPRVTFGYYAENLRLASEPTAPTLQAEPAPCIDDWHRIGLAVKLRGDVVHCPTCLVDYGTCRTGFIEPKPAVATARTYPTSTLPKRTRYPVSTTPRRMKYPSPERRKP